MKYNRQFILICFSALCAGGGLLLYSCTHGGELSERFYGLINKADTFYYSSQTDSALKVLSDAYFLADNDYDRAYAKQEMAWTYYSIGNVDQTRAILRECMEYYDRHKTLDKRILNRKMSALMLLADIEREKGNVKEALRQYARAANIAREIDDHKVYVDAQTYIYTNEESVGNYATAIEGYKSVLEFCDHENMQGYRFSILNKLQRSYLQLGDITECRNYVSQMERTLVRGDKMEDCVYNVALFYLSDSIKNVAMQRHCVRILEEMTKDGDVRYLRETGLYEVLVLYYIEQEDFEKARNYLGILSEMENNEPNNDLPVATRMLFVRYFISSMQLDSARIELSLMDPDRVKEESIADYMRYMAYSSWLCFRKADYQCAYSVLKNRYLILDSLKKESIRHNVAYKSYQYSRDTTVLSQDLQLKHQMNHISDMKFWRQIVFAVLLLVVLLVAFVAFVMNARRMRKHADEIKQRNHRLESEVVRQTNVLEKREQELKKKNDELHEQMRYASNIQHCMLPAKESLENKYISEYFVLYKPCTLISGDFYWTSQLGSKKFICLGDATGHGIPGAFIAMVSSTILNDLALSIPEPTPLKLLTELDVSIRNILMTNDVSHGNDSVDISMLCIDESTQKMTIALARHTAYVVRERGEMLKIPGVKRSIGDTDPEFVKRPYAETTLDLHKGDCLYMTSDGYESQLGGPLYKKMKRNRMTELFLKYYMLPLNLQMKSLDDELLAWQNGGEQTDDVLMMGMRISEL